MFLYPETSESVLTIKGPVGRINRAVWGPLNKTIISAGEDMVIRVWDTEVGVLISVGFFVCLISSDIIHFVHITDFVQSHINVYVYLGETHAMTNIFIFHGILSWINWETRSYEISSDKMLKTIAHGSLFYQNVGKSCWCSRGYDLLYHINLSAMDFLLILILPLCKLYCLVVLCWTSMDCFFVTICYYSCTAVVSVHLRSPFHIWLLLVMIFHNGCYISMEHFFTLISRN